MPFDGSGILLRLVPDRAAGEVVASWEDSRPAGTWYQVYHNGRLAARTTARRVSLPLGPGRHLVQVGAVPEAEAAVIQPPEAPAGVGSGRAVLTWTGPGSAAAFRVWRGPTPGVAPDPATDAPAGPDIPAGRVPGWAVGGWASGGWGAGSRAYRWADPEALAPGTWHYAVAALDAAGQAGTAATLTVEVAGPPRAVSPIAGDPEGRRVAIDATNPAAPVLRWGHSPDWTDPTP